MRLLSVGSTEDVRGYKHLKMSAFAGYTIADGEHRATGGPRGKGDDQEGSDREDDRRGADVDSGSRHPGDHGPTPAAVEAALGAPRV